jgi:hypothetical protein
MLKNAAILKCGIIGGMVLWLVAIQAVWNPILAEEFDVLNQSKTTIYHLFVAPEGSYNWSPDALGEDEEDALEPDDSITLRDLDPGDYQFKIVVQNNRTCVVPNVQLEKGKTLALKDEFLERCR